VYVLENGDSATLEVEVAEEGHDVVWGCVEIQPGDQQDTSRVSSDQVVERFTVPIVQRLGLENDSLSSLKRKLLLIPMEVVVLDLTNLGYRIFSAAARSSSFENFTHHAIGLRKGLNWSLKGQRVLVVCGKGRSTLYRSG